MFGVKKVTDLQNLVARLEVQVRGLVDAQHSLMTRLDRIGKQLEGVDKRVHYNDQLLTTIVQLAMVRAGMGREAAAHQQVSTLRPEMPDWSDESEEEWPPPGTVAVDLMEEAKE